jgi:uncharacterized membrane protein YphA (DoxX/SURF4 family)
MGIYVEIRIRAPMDVLWQHTQQPELHERWDLRFSKIDYLPRATEAEPQRFRYATRIGFGLPISSADPRSLIREGSGYWKYLPTDDGVRFLTGYDYEPRFGRAGYVVDRFFFRPLMGWATAWSFDRLRLWLERGVSPAAALRQTLTRTTARLALAFIFAYQGLVPKLIARHADEIAMLRDAGMPSDLVPATLTLIGVAEIFFALTLLYHWRRRWPARVALGLMALATLGVSLRSPGYLEAAFNPISLNLALHDLQRGA